MCQTVRKTKRRLDDDGSRSRVKHTGEMSDPEQATSVHNQTQPHADRLFTNLLE